MLLHSLATIPHHVYAYMYNVVYILSLLCMCVCNMHTVCVENMLCALCVCVCECVYVCVYTYDSTLCVCVCECVCAFTYVYYLCLSRHVLAKDVVCVCTLFAMRQIFPLCKLIAYLTYVCGT